MSLQAQQIVALACQMAKVTGFTSQAGQLLNVIQADLCDTYDFELARGTFTFNMSSTATPSSSNPNITGSSGPYILPADYLRAKIGDIMWFNQGVPMKLVPCDIQELDMQIQQAGFQSYPYIWATDMATSPPAAYVWPPASGSYQTMVRYYRRMPDITTPESSTAVPWFPNQDYLITRLAGELMKLADDDRAAAFLGDDPLGAMGILRRYLNLKDDTSNRAKRVTLDGRRFGSSFSRLPNTKTVGW